MKGKIFRNSANLGFIILAALYFFSYFHRVSLTVISLDLIRTFHISATSLGLMSSAYFYSYAGAQLPVGMFSDVLGTRRTILMFTLLSFLGTMMFALAQDIVVATLGRALIGLGVGGIYIPTAKFISSQYHERQFAGLNGVLLAVGNAGAIFATAPLAFLVESLGWRSCFLSVGFIILGLLILSILFLRDRFPLGDKIQFGKLFKGLISSRNIWLLVLSNSCAYGALMAFQGLWAVPYLVNVYKVTRTTAGNAVMSIALGMIIGAPAIGVLSDKVSISRKNVFAGWLSVFLCMWALIALFPESLSYESLYGIFFLMGFSASSVVLVGAMVNENYPRRTFATTASFINVFVFLGVMLFQTLTGFALDIAGRIESGYSVAGYRGVFFICLTGAAIALISAAFIKRGDARK